MEQVFFLSFVVAMTNIRRQLTVIKSNAHAHTRTHTATLLHQKELGVTAAATPLATATHYIAAPPIWGLCSSNIFAPISFRLLGKFTFSYAAIFNKKLF